MVEMVTGTAPTRQMCALDVVAAWFTNQRGIGARQEYCTMLPATMLPRSAIDHTPEQYDETRQRTSEHSEPPRISTFSAPSAPDAANSTANSAGLTSLLPLATDTHLSPGPKRRRMQRLLDEQYVEDEQHVYAVSCADIVAAVRHAEVDRATKDFLLEILMERNRPLFLKHACGLRSRPELREDLIQNMCEQLLREAQDPRETYMISNFGNYVRCLANGQFSRMLRQEGLNRCIDEKGQVFKRGHSVPRTLMRPISLATYGSEDYAMDGSPLALTGSPVAVADPEDGFDRALSDAEYRRLLNLLTSEQDREIVRLRAVEGYRWAAIRQRVSLSDRGVRSRFSNALRLLQTYLSAEEQGTATTAHVNVSIVKQSA